MTDDTNYGLSVPARTLWYGGLGVILSVGLYMLSFVIYPEEYARVTISRGDTDEAGEVTRTVSIPMERSWVWKPLTSKMENAELLLFLKMRQESDAWSNTQFERYGDRIPNRIWNNRPTMVLLDNLWVDPSVEVSVQGMARYVGDAVWRFISVVLFLAVVGLPVLLGSVDTLDRSIRTRHPRGI